MAELIDRSCELADALSRGLAALPGGELVAPATLNQALVRFRSPEVAATEADHDARTTAVIEAINAEGTAFFSGSIWKGRRVMRVSVINWRTRLRDVEVAVAAAARVLARLDLSP